MEQPHPGHRCPGGLGDQGLPCTFLLADGWEPHRADGPLPAHFPPPPAVITGRSWSLAHGLCRPSRPRRLGQTGKARGPCRGRAGLERDATPRPPPLAPAAPARHATAAPTRHGRPWCSVHLGGSVHVSAAVHYTEHSGHCRTGPGGGGWRPRRGTRPAGLGPRKCVPLDINQIPVGKDEDLSKWKKQAVTLGVQRSCRPQRGAVSTR